MLSQLCVRGTCMLIQSRKHSSGNGAAHDKLLAKRSSVQLVFLGQNHLSLSRYPAAVKAKAASCAKHQVQKKEQEKHRHSSLLHGAHVLFVLPPTAAILALALHLQPNILPVKASQCPHPWELMKGQGSSHTNSCEGNNSQI